MANYNKTILLGNLTRDPQLKYLPNQTAVADFGLAVNRKYKTAGGEDREEVLFIDVTAFGKQGETINEHCRKGKQLLVEGRLKLDEWEDKNGGGKRSKIGLVLEGFQFVGPRESDGQQQQRPAPSQRPEKSSMSIVPSGGPFDGPVVENSEIPFAWEGPKSQQL